MAEQSYARLIRPPSVSNKPERHKSRRASRETARSIRGVLKQNGFYVALSAQVALERRLETIASNVANMNTPRVTARTASLSRRKSPRRATTASATSRPDPGSSRAVRAP